MHQKSVCTRLMSGLFALALCALPNSTLAEDTANSVPETSPAPAAAEMQPAETPAPAGEAISAPSAEASAPAAEAADKAPAAEAVHAPEAVRVEQPAAVAAESRETSEAQASRAPEGAPCAGKTGVEPAGQVPVTLIRHLSDETELPAMQISLGLVNFVGETAPIYPEEEAYAILPLSHDAVLEVYDLHYDGQELKPMEETKIVHKMGANEAYVVRVPSFGGMPARGICVSSNGRKNCWNPNDKGFNEGFLRWSRTKNIK